MKNLPPLIVLYAKAPVPGRVKTRLGIDPAKAAELHSAFVRDTLVMLSALRGEADLEISTDEPTDAWSGFAVARSLQSRGNLGDRMFGTIDRAIDQGHPRVMILGSDSPGLPAEHIR